MAGRSATHIEERIRHVVRLVAEGWSYGELVQFITERWGVGERQGAIYIRRAREQVRQQWEVDRQEFLAELMNRYQATFRKAFEAEQYSAAIGALNAMAKLARVVE